MEAMSNDWFGTRIELPLREIPPGFELVWEPNEWTDERELILRSPEQQQRVRHRDAVREFRRARRSVQDANARQWHFARKARVQAKLRPELHAKWRWWSSASTELGRAIATLYTEERLERRLLAEAPLSRLGKS